MVDTFSGSKLRLSARGKPVGRSIARSVGKLGRKRRNGIASSYKRMFGTREVVKNMKEST